MSSILETRQFSKGSVANKRSGFRRDRQGGIPIDTDRLEALAEFAAGAGHEINNPLATISGRVQLLLRTETDPQRRQDLLNIGAQALRIRDMIGDLMLFARPPEPDREALDLSEVVDSVVGNLSQQGLPEGVSIEVKSSGPVPVFADRTQLCVVVGDLIQNSLHAAGEEGGTVRISCEPVFEHREQFALLTVTDWGRGFSEEDRKHLFDPFYSGHQAGRGLGFGLPKIWRIVSNHEGRIEVDSIPQEETTFRVYWPAGMDDGGNAAV